MVNSSFTSEGHCRVQPSGAAVVADIRVDTRGPGVTAAVPLPPVRPRL
jgi:hypothetical protein